MAKRDYNFQRDLVNRVPKKELLISGFGLQPLKSKIYNFDEDAPNDTALLPSSYLGTEVFSNISFDKGEYLSLEGEEIPYPKGEYSEGLTINTVLFGISQSKNIVKTPIQGRNGTVKEYISDGDYMINIRGMLVDPSPQRYPEEQVDALVQICQAQRAIRIESWYLNNVFGISDIVIESYRFPQREGFQNTQLFDIKAISDESIEKIIRGQTF